jgi:hypothetical protein
VAVTTTANLAAATFHKCTATSADYTVTLPAAASSNGALVGVRIDGSSTKLVTVKGNGAELIDGQNTRVMWANEVAILKCDGSNWCKIGGKSIPMIAKLAGGAQTDLTGSFAHNVYTAMTTVGFDNSSMTNAANAKFKIRRAGYYFICGRFQIDGSATSFTGTMGRFLMSVKINAGYTALLEICNFVGGQYPTPPYNEFAPLAAGDELQMDFQHSLAANTVDIAAGSMTVQEVPVW